MYVILFAMRVASTKFVRKLLHVDEFWIQFSLLTHFTYLDFRHCTHVFQAVFQALRDCQTVSDIL